MTLYPNRAYSSPAQPTVLNTAITAGATTMVIPSNPATLNWPATPNGTTAPPYTLLLDWGSNIAQGTSGAAEVVLVTGVAANTPSAGLYQLTITRGQDGTTGAIHNPPGSGSNVYHGSSGQDFGEYQTHETSTGATTYPGNSNSPLNPVHVHGIGEGSNGSVVVGTLETQTLKNKTLTDASNTLPALNTIAANSATSGSVAMNSNKLTGLANGSAATDSAAYGQTPAGGNTATVAQGGTGQTTQQAAINNLAGAVTNATFLRGNGTNALMAAIQVADVPTLNQNTTGSSGSCTGNAATATSATTAGGAPPIGTAGGGLGGSYPNPTVNVSSPVTYSGGAVGVQATVVNGWTDVTQQGANAVLATNSGTVNSTNLGTLISNAAQGATLYFPAGTYPFLNNVTVNKALTFQGQMGQGGSVPGTYLQMTGTTAGLFTVNTNWGPQFSNLGFTCSATQTAGACITNAGMDYVNINNCVFGGASATVTLFNCIQYTGATANNWNIQNCNFGNFSGTAIGLSVANGILNNCVINGQYGSTATYATAGINISAAGGMFITNCDVVTCTNNILINPTGSGSSVSVNSVQVVNCYFDQSNGASLAISGAGATNRCLFSSCWFTTLAGASSSSCVSVDSTYAWTTAGQGIVFSGCFIYNTQATATATGINLQAFGDVEITDCCIAGWATAVSMTASATSGVSRPLLVGNVIGPSGNIAGNATGIAVGSATTYGTISITGNSLAGNTTAPLTDTSTVAAGSQKLISNNTGLPCGPSTTAYTASSVLAASTVTTVGSLPIPANSLRAGQRFRVRLCMTTAATAGTCTVALTLGTAPTTIASIVATNPADTGTWLVNAEVIMTSASACTCFVQINGTTTDTTFVDTAAGIGSGTTTASGIADATATTLNITADASAASTWTVWGASMEAVQQ